MASPTLATAELDALTSFVGREPELHDVVELVRDSRLVTVVGPGGIGKTRFAGQAVRTLNRRFPEPALFVDLTPIHNPGRIGAAVLAALGGQHGAGSELDASAALIGERALLLVLDNCEQVIDGAAEAAQRLLLACPELRLLATSREPLGIPGEAVFRLQPLPVPRDDTPLSPGEASANPSVALFVARASAAQRTFALTHETAAQVISICRAVDGIPLAIELSAARLRTLPLAQLASRMATGLGILAGGPRTAPERHRTMRAAIAWSVDSLPPAERALFRRLAAFSGGWALEAAEGVCAGGDVERDSVLDLLEALLDRSLVVTAAVGGRFRMLEPIVEYAREALLDSGEADVVGAAHCRWFRQLAAAAEPHLRAHGSAYWREVLSADNDNLHAALAWAAAHEAQIDDGLHIAGDLRWYVNQRALEAEYLPVTTRLVTAPLLTSARARLQALLAHSWNAQGVGHLDEGERSAAEACDIASELGDDLWMARAKHLWGLALSYRGAHDEATAMWEDALRLAESSGSGVDVGLVLIFLGIPTGDASTRPLLERALGLVREAGWEMGQVMAGGELAACMRVEGDLAGAERQSLVVLDLCRRIGSPRHMSLQAIVTSLIRIQRGSYSEAYPPLREGLEVAIRIGATSRYRMAVTAAAALEATAGDAALAARWLGGVDADQFALDYEDRPVADLAIEAARRRLGERFEVEFRQGQAANAEQTAREVLIRISATAPPESPVEAIGRLRLTARETEILRLVAAGGSNRDIAQKLVLSTRTVETHIANVYSKIDVQNRVEATRWAIEAGLTANA